MRCAGPPELPHSRAVNPIQQSKMGRQRLSIASALVTDQIGLQMRARQDRQLQLELSALHTRGFLHRRLRERRPEERLALRHSTQTTLTTAAMGESEKASLCLQKSFELGAG